MREQKAIWTNLKPVPCNPRGYVFRFAFLLRLYLSKMSRTSEPNTSAIEDVAQSIIKMLGPCSLGQARLSSTGRSPIFPDISLCELVPVSLLQGLGHAVRTQLADIVEERLSSMRQRYLDRYRQLVHKMYSLDHAGFADLDHEMALCGTIEARYHRCISEIRRNLIRLLGQPATIGDNRNTRGGFGDVGPPHELKLTIQRTLLILETAFSHTKSPLASEIEHLSRLTSLEPHQVSPRSPYPYPFFMACILILISRSAPGYVSFFLFRFTTYSTFILSSHPFPLAATAFGRV